MSKVLKELEGLEELLVRLDKTFGKGSVYRVGDRPDTSIEKVSSGSLLLDNALGGGYPKGRIIEIYGGESSGKTTLTLHLIAEAQKLGIKCAIVDAEHALDIHYAKKLGVITDDLIISQPDHGEQALEIVDTMVDSGVIGVCVIDSVAALIPKKELEGEMGDSNMGLHARLMSQAMRKLTSKISKTDCIVVFINQIREKIGVIFGNPETTTGGNALKFYASQRIELRKSTKIEDGGEQVGHLLKAKIVKNKIFPPYKVAELTMLYGVGISLDDEIIDLGVIHNIINKSGSWYSYGDTKLGQGKNSVRDLLKDNPELREELLVKIQKVFK